MLFTNKKYLFGWRGKMLPRDEVGTSFTNILLLHVIGILLSRFFIEKMNEQWKWSIFCSTIESIFSSCVEWSQKWGGFCSLYSNISPNYGYTDQIPDPDDEDESDPQTDGDVYADENIDWEWFKGIGAG